MSNKENRRKRHQGSRLEFRRLENRNLLAGITFDPSTGIVSVDGTESADSVLVQNVGPQLRVTLVNQVSRLFVSAQVNEISITARGGDDWVRNDSSTRIRANGQAGRDTLIGGNTNDILNGGPDDDLLRGLGGDDTLVGGSGNDRLFSDDGNDTIFGDDGNDLSIGGHGNDRIYGGDGDDSNFGGLGDDFVDSGNGNDIVGGQAGNDDLNGGAGDDRLYGNAGDDNLNGNGGDDKLIGSVGRDRLFGELGDDFFSGGDDDDQLYGGGGRDLLFGDNGDDSIFSGNDRVYARGGNGNDDLFGGSSNDVLLGESGFDRLFGSAGDDILRGGDGDDDLTGGSGSDRLHGENGNDDFFDDSSDNVSSDSDDFSVSGDVEIRGTVANLNSAARTFSLNGVPVSYAAARVDGNLANGEFFKAEGSLVDGTLRAHHIEKKLPGDSQDNFESFGVISNINATNQTFDFLGFSVNYSNAEINGTLTNGSLFKVEGNLANGTIVAREVETLAPAFQFQGERNFELRGRIENLDTNARTFTLLGVPVTYSQSQITTSLTNNAFVKVEGNFNGTRLNAREIESELPEDNENSELIGVVTNLNTSAKTFQVLGITIDYSDSRLEISLSSGARVEIEGFFQAGFLLQADRIRSV